MAAAVPAATALARTAPPSPERSAAVAGSAASAGFVPNRGQLPASVGFAASGAGYSFAFERDRVRLSLAGSKRTTRLALRFVGASPGSTLGATGRQRARVSYFRGSDPSGWATNLPTYSTVVYHDVWPGIDARFTLRSGKLKYEFRVRPGGRVDDIRLAYDGASRLSVDTRGNLRVVTAGGVLTDARPTTYQLIGGKRRAIHSRYALGQSSFGFAVGAYDRRAPLVLDPGIVYSTFLNPVSLGAGMGVTVDASGSAYVTGQTGTGDVFVAKLAPDGSSVAFAAYLVGSGLDEARGVAVDAGGNVNLAGFTSSPDFPTASAVDPSYNGSRDGFFAKLDPSGSALLVSTYLGGAGDDRALAVALDAAGNAHVTGETSSEDFPVTPGAVGEKLGGEYDVFVTKIASTGTFAYSTFLGGPFFDNGLAIAVGPNGNAYVTGKARAGFPTTENAFDKSPNGGFDVFVAELAADGSDLVYSTYIGGDGWDEGLGIGIDAGGSAYLTGNVQSPDFPTTTGAFDGQLSGPVDLFVTKLNADGSDLVYSTFVGGTSWDEGDGLAVDGAGRVYVTGHLASGDYPTTNDAFDLTFNGVVDGFLTVVDASGTGLEYSTYLGGSDFDAGWALAIDGSGAAYIAGSTDSADFPAPFGSAAIGSGFVTKIGATVLPPPPPPPPPSPTFALDVSPATQRVVRGDPVDYAVTIVPGQGFAGEVSLEVSGLPDNTTASFSPNPAALASILTIQTSVDTPADKYRLTIRGTSDSIEQTATFELDVHCCPGE